MPRRRRNKFKTERFEAKVNLRLHQAAGMNGQEFHLFRKGPNLADLSLEQVLSEFLRVMLARRAYSKNCSPGRQRRLWPRRCVAVPAATRQAP
jgi:hypothetical protein